MTYMSFEIIDKPFDSIILFKTTLNNDARGSFNEFWSKKKYKSLGISDEIAQINYVTSKKKGTLRGLHAQRPPHSQSKIVKCTRGSIFDVSIDFRKDSPNFGNWYGVKLTAKSSQQIYIPEGFLHGYVTLSDNTEIIYACSNSYNQDSEIIIKFDDPHINIRWPNLVSNFIISRKDTQAQNFNDFDSPF